MTLTYFNDINVYFHMKNHYKILKQVKSVIDTSIPQSLLKSPLAMHNLQKRLKGTTNEQLRKIYNSPIYMPKRGGQVKRHNCLNLEAKSEASLRTGSLPSRPATRRNAVVTPKETLTHRSCSVGPPIKTEKMFKFRQKKRPSVSSTRSSNSDNQNANLQLDLKKENAKSPSESAPSTKRSSGSKNNNSNNSGSPESSPKVENKNFLKESSEEHEYLLFLLRITEDIIVNDFYSNNDIKQVFKFHIDANKCRLNVRKMHFHIANLCKELNLDCKEYQNEPVENSQLESKGKFKNSPTSRSYLNNEAFLKCHDCSAIRTSSLYKFPSQFDGNGHVIDAPQMDNGDSESSISPSLLRLLEKLSLGRVTECTEPVASTSTMNSPNIAMFDMFGKDESKICDNGEKCPVDFDTFVKELNSKEETSILQSKNLPDNSPDIKKDNIALESPPVQLYTALIPDSPLANTNLLENQSTVLSPEILPQNTLSPSKLLSNENSKSEIEISEKDIKSTTNSEKYESEFEKSTSSNSISKTDNSEKSDEEKLKSDEKEREKNVKVIESRSIILDESPSDRLKKIGDSGDIIRDNLVTVKNLQFPLNSSENKRPLPVLSPQKVVESGDTNTVLPECPNTNQTSLKTDDGDLSPVKITSNLVPIEVQFQDGDSGSARHEIIHSKLDLSGQTLVTTALDKGPLQPEEVSQSKIKDTSSESSPNAYKAPSIFPKQQVDARKSSDSSNNEKHDPILRVILQGSLKDSDYVMIKGPVYVYKPLLNSEPKLVVYNNDNNPTSRRNSIDSQHSNRTFTVDHNHVQTVQERVDATEQVEQDNVDEAIQFDQPLHSFADDSMESILELTRRAYSQFTDSKLLQSDYDLTPQKDSDNKYHHLLVDATTSISGVNIKESLLLSDDYLVKKDENQQNLNTVFNAENVDDQMGVDIDNYLMFDSQVFENNYVIPGNRKLLASMSMPKLITASDTPGERSYEALDERERNEMLIGYSSDLINFDIPSQDSSLRSEGETYQNVDKLRSGIPWSGYFN